jgi:hypothetical protein
MSSSSSAICKTAKVSLNWQNTLPNLGLHHGSVGTIEDIVYHEREKTQHGELPAYVNNTYNHEVFTC